MKHPFNTGATKYCTNMLVLYATLACSLVFPAVNAAYNGPVYVNPAAASQSLASTTNIAPVGAASGHVTQTVYGFLDFTTTIGNTVMVFSPQSAPVAEIPKKPVPTKPAIETKPSSISVDITSEIKPSPSIPSKTNIIEKKSSKAAPLAISSVVEVRVSAAPTPSPVQLPAVTFLSSIVEVRSSGDTPTTQPPPPPPPAVVAVDAGTSNNLLGQEVYDFLSKQPAEIVDETYKVYDIKPSSSKIFKAARSSVDSYIHSSDTPAVSVVASRLSLKAGPSTQPTGLISTMGGTVVREGVTTVHETRVIGTYISGKYAQVLQSTSTIKQNPSNNNGIIPAIRASPSLRILKTAAPTGPGLNNKIHLDPTPAGGSLIEETISIDKDDLGNRPLRRSAVAPGRNSDFLSRLHRSRAPTFSDSELDEDYDIEVSPRPVSSSSSPARKPSSRLRPSQTVRPSFSSRFTNSRYGRQSSELATVSVFTETPRYSTASVNPNGNGRRFTSYNRNRGSSSNNNNNNSNNNNNNVSTRTPPSAIGSSEPSYTRRGYKPRHSSPENNSNHGSNSNNHSPTSAPATSLNKFKLTRPAGRWQYKTSPKPRVTIRQQRPADVDVTPADDELNALTPPASHAALTSPQPGRDDSGYSNEENNGPATESLAASNGELQAEGAEDLHHVQAAPHSPDQVPTPTAETIKVEISTPADFSDVYFEIATIRSPYTFQVGTLKNTRFITVTSTLERSLASNEPDISPTEPLTENILATSTPPPFEVNQLPADASVATLPAILLASDVETPPLETVTETFNTTQLLLKTHILPVVQQGNIQTTKMYTLVQSYHVTRFVTAVKTLPPSEAFQFLPSRSLNEFNSRLDEAGSELHELELSENEQEGEGEERRIFPPDLMGHGDLASVGVDFDFDNADKLRFKSILPSKTSTVAAEPTAVTSPPLSPEQLQHIALLRYLNPLAPAPAITTSKPIIKLETVYESHIIPIWNGLSTSFSTISRPIATLSKTEYELQTITPPVPSVPGFGQQYTITSTPIVTQTVVTHTDSKIIKLNFGAKTVFSTLFSTRVQPTLLTTYITTSVPVQPTAPAFPGFFPGAFPGYPFVG